jgi:hypothetical protein
VAVSQTPTGNLTLSLQQCAHRHLIRVDAGEGGDIGAQGLLQAEGQVAGGVPEWCTGYSGE